MSNWSKLSEYISDLVVVLAVCAVAVLTVDANRRAFSDKMKGVTATPQKEVPKDDESIKSTVRYGSAND